MNLRNRWLLLTLLVDKNITGIDCIIEKIDTNELAT